LELTSLGTCESSIDMRLTLISQDESSNGVDDLLVPNFNLQGPEQTVRNQPLHGLKRSSELQRWGSVRAVGSYLQ
jgi:hypothetical protein